MTNPAQLYLVCAAALIALGIFGVLRIRHLIRQIIALNIAGSGAFLVFAVSAIKADGPIADPVPQAMVLTGIVVAVSASAVALALATRVTKDSGRPELSEGGDE
ncbi:MAG: NADH-quinone oxidoreductase subunit K [Deltaproteobacteria bacterium]|nr:NADH-quinone oxidoreductase subunit K [Deltaproteobacteria bacterium]